MKSISYLIELLLYFEVHELFCYTWYIFKRRYQVCVYDDAPPRTPAIHKNINLKYFLRLLRRPRTPSSASTVLIPGRYKICLICVCCRENIKQVPHCTPKHPSAHTIKLRTFDKTKRAKPKTSDPSNSSHPRQGQSPTGRYSSRSIPSCSSFCTHSTSSTWPSLSF